MKKYLLAPLFCLAALCGTLGYVRDARGDAGPVSMEPAGAPHAAALTLAAAAPDAGTVDAAVAVGTAAPAPAVTPAVVLPDVEKDPAGFLMGLITAVKQGQWAMVAGGVLMGAVWLLRRYGKRFIPWLGTGFGGKVTAVAVSLAGTFSVALMVGGWKAVTWRLVLGAIATAAIASGLFSWFKPEKKPDEKKPLSETPGNELMAPS